MKIVVYGTRRQLGALEKDRVVDLHQAYQSVLQRSGAHDPQRLAAQRLGLNLQEFIANGSQALDAAEEAIAFVAAHGTDDALASPLESVKLHAPWPGGRIAMVGGNFPSHIAGMEGHTSLEDATRRARAQGQWGFWKEAADIAGPGDQLPYPKRTEYLDYEAEVAIIIGKRGKDIRADQVDEYVWGVTLVDDVSIRDDTSRSSPMSYNLAKNFDGATAMGPAIVVRESVDLQKVDCELKVNSQLRQRFNTSEMIFSFGEVLEYLSRDFTFRPGDVISGGTAQGTAADTTPQPTDGAPRSKERFLKPGDIIEISSPQIGSFTNAIVRASS